MELGGAVIWAREFCGAFCKVHTRAWFHLPGVLPVLDGLDVFDELGVFDDL